MYCMFCGKVLTTGDRIDRCYPDCNPIKISYDKSDEIIISKLKAERDQLKTENERLKAALQNFSLEEREHYEMSDVAYSMRDVADEALKR